MFGGHADAVVGDGDGVAVLVGLEIGAGLDADLDMSVAADGVCGVLEEIDEELA